MLRRRLQLRSSQIAAHPYWASEAGRSPAARVELRGQARCLPGVATRLEGALRVMAHPPADLALFLNWHAPKRISTGIRQTPTMSRGPRGP